MAYPITRGGRVEGFRHRGSKRTKKPEVKRRIRRREVKPRAAIFKDPALPSPARELPVDPPSIEATFPNEGPGFFDVWDAEAFKEWAIQAKRALLKKGVPREEVDRLWDSFPLSEDAVIDGDHADVITFLDGETFIDEVETVFNKTWPNTDRYWDQFGVEVTREELQNLYQQALLGAYNEARDDIRALAVEEGHKSPRRWFAEQPREYQRQLLSDYGGAYTRLIADFAPQLGWPTEKQSTCSACSLTGDRCAQVHCPHA